MLTNVNQRYLLTCDSWSNIGFLTARSILAHRSALTMSSKTEKADVAKAGEDLQAYLEFLGEEFSAKDRGIGFFRC